MGWNCGPAGRLLRQVGPHDVADDQHRSGLGFTDHASGIPRLISLRGRFLGLKEIDRILCAKKITNHVEPLKNPSAVVLS